MNKFCSRCGGVLDLETAMDIEHHKNLEENKLDKVNEVMKILTRDPAIRVILMDRLNGIKA